MRITIEIRRRHLCVLPAAAATVALVLTAGVIGGLITVVATVGAFVGTALLLAAGDTVVTRTLPAIRRWRCDRALQRSIESSIPVHPSETPRHPKHQRVKGAAA